MIISKTIRTLNFIITWKCNNKSSSFKVKQNSIKQSCYLGQHIRIDQSLWVSASSSMLVTWLHPGLTAGHANEVTLAVMIYTSLVVPSSSCRISGSLVSSASSNASHVFICKILDPLIGQEHSPYSTLLWGTGCSPAPLGPEQALLMLFQWKQDYLSGQGLPHTWIILVLDSQNLYPDLSFYLVLRARTLCRPSLELWFSKPKVHKKHLVNCWKCTLLNPTKVCQLNFCVEGLQSSWKASLLHVTDLKNVSPSEASTTCPQSHFCPSLPQQGAVYTPAQPVKGQSVTSSPLSPGFQCISHDKIVLR